MVGCRVRGTDDDCEGNQAAGGEASEAHEDQRENGHAAGAELGVGRPGARAALVSRLVSPALLELDGCLHRQANFR